MAHASLSPQLIAKVHQLFPQDGGAVAALLEFECGSNLPGLKPEYEDLILRIRCAVLKLSDGSRDRLSAELETVKKDWRDILMGAGFGNDLTAHFAWLRQR